MTSRVSTPRAAPSTPEVRRHSTGNRPYQPNLLHNPDDFSESDDDDEPPPYSRLDPLTHPEQSQESQPPLISTVNELRPERPRPAPSQRPSRPPQSFPVNQSRPRPQRISPPSPRMGPPSPIGNPHAAPYPPFQQPQNTPFQYPPGYYCPKCYNTGIKSYNGSPCGTCARMFGRQTADV